MPSRRPNRSKTETGFFGQGATLVDVGAKLRFYSTTRRFIRRGEAEGGQLTQRWSTRRANHTVLAGSGVRNRNRASCSKCVSYDVRGAWVEQPRRRHDQVGCRKDHRIGTTRTQKFDGVASGRDQRI